MKDRSDDTATAEHFRAMKTMKRSAWALDGSPSDASEIPLAYWEY